MFVLKDNMSVGANNGRAVLVDQEGDEPVKYLSHKYSLILFSLLYFDSMEECIAFLCKRSAADQHIEEDIEAFVQTNEHCLQKLDATKSEAQKMKAVSLLQKLSHPDQRNAGNEYRLDFPVKLVWIPTFKCNRSCRYCGVARLDAEENECKIPFSKVMERLEEAVRGGVTSVVIHGGEPLFCYDENIFTALKFLRDHHVDIKISTKNHISPGMAKRLADTGLHEIQLSLDTVDEDLLEALYGEKNYLPRFQNSVANLKSVGIDIRLNIVVSTINYQYISELLVYLSSLGVEKVILSHYRSGGETEEDFSLSLNQRTWLFKEIRKNKRNFSFKKFRFFPYEPVPPAQERPLCESCRVAMLVLPNGTCCYCDFLSEDSRFILGDLHEQTIEDVWYSKEVERFFNPLADFSRGSRCADCSGFDYCVKRGYCFLKMNRDQILSPDYVCAECGGNRL